MGVGIANAFANSSRHARQNVREKIFAENRPASILLTIVFAVLGLAFLLGDFAIDEDHITKALVYRVVILAVLLSSALVKRFSRSIRYNFAVSYISLATCEAGLVFLLNGQEGGLTAGVGEFIYFFLGCALFCPLFPFNISLWGYMFLTLVPFAVGIPFATRFPTLLYASVLAPACILTIMAHWKIRSNLVEIQRLRQDAGVSVLLDPVTGLWNQRGLERMFKRTAKLALGKPAQQFFLLIEIEGLEQIKSISDKKTAASIAEEIGELVESSLKGKFIAACLSDHQFACILQQISRQEALEAAESLRKTLAGKEFDYPGSEDGKLSFKVNIGIVSTELKEDLNTLVNRAKVGLNHAAAMGGNQCVLL